MGGTLGPEEHFGVSDPTLTDPSVDPPSIDGPASAAQTPVPTRRDLSLVHGTLVGRYMILRLLGRGGMGAVYAAHDPKLDRQVALKLLHSPRGDAPERLVREAQALARLSDPHVVAVYDAGEIEGRVFIAMQLVDGEDLSSALRRKPSPGQILEWFVDAGKGLAAAHAAGLVHRDFKPGNVLIDKRGHVAVTDFGLVRTVAADDDRSLTGMGDILGTPAFMSPEQHNLQPATPASDQFSFCVSLWDALFDRHPFVDGDRGSMSPFEIGHKIFDGSLIPPPRRTRIPRRVIDALTRGLARDPAKRWPSMDALLAELAPAQPRRRTWPIVAGVVAAAAIGGGAVWLLVSDTDKVAACKSDVEHRADAAWSPVFATQLHDRFVASGRSYAEPAARQATDIIDHYARRWRDLAADVCTAEHASTTRTELPARRRSCLDSRLDAMRDLIHLLVTEDRPEFVDHAFDMANGLPDLGDCADPATLLAGPGAPPADKAGDIGRVQLELGVATARGNGGDTAARDQIATLATRADGIGWAPLQIRAYLALGERDLALFTPNTDALVKAGELATAAHLDRDAARAWAGAVVSAGLDRKADVVAVLIPIERAAAARTGDRDLIIDAQIAHGRALARLGKYQDAADVCRAANTAAQGVQNRTSIDRARDCLLETLTPLGALSEVEPMLDQMIVDQTAAFGADHPRVADYLFVRASIAITKGKLDDARKDADRVVEIRKKAFPPRHFKIAEAMSVVAKVTMAEGKYAEAKQLFEDALSIASEAKPEPVLLLGQLHTILAAIAQQVDHDQAAAMRHYEEAVPLVKKRAGADSLELGILLSNYGQIKAAEDLDAGLAILGEARGILDRLKDKRATLVALAMAEVEDEHKRFTAAKAHAEDMLAHASPDEDPANIALGKWALAQAIAGTKGDIGKARQLAGEARATLVQLGAAYDAYLKAIDAWLKK